MWHTDSVEKHQLIIVHSVVCGLFSDIVSISNYVELNDRMNDESCTGKNFPDYSHSLIDVIDLHLPEAI